MSTQKAKSAPAKQPPPKAASPKAAAKPRQEPAPKPAPTPAVNSSQLISTLSLSGLEAFKAALAEYKPSLPVLKKLKELIDFAVAQPDSPWAGNQAPVKALDVHIESRGLSLVPNRGRLPPVEGDKRRYKIQQLSDGSPFLRLPVTSLHLAKGEEVVVDFAHGAIHVVPAKAAPDADDVDLEDAEDDIPEDA